MKQKTVTLIGVFFLAILIGIASPTVYAENKEQDNHTFTQPFQNKTISLTGTSVRSTMYFTKIDYWDVKKASFNMTYQITQLKNNQTSDLTVAVNGVKFYSWRPENTTGIQQKTIEIPLELIKETNTLTVEGQIINQAGNDMYNLIETPANWLTMYEGSNVNFQYDLQLPENTIHSFYNHFVGADTIANKHSVILTPENASEKELAAATHALAGAARLITTSEELLPMTSLNKEQSAPYQLIIASYDKLPDQYKSQIDSKRVEDQAVLKFFNQPDKHVLVATSKDEDLLVRAGRYLANYELMTQTDKEETTVDENTDTFSSTLEFDGNYPLTSTGDKLEGAYHQEQTYFVNLPVDRNNANGSRVHLHFKYAENLDFDSSLVTVYANDKPIGSKKLTAARANGDELNLEFPKNLEIADSFVLKVAFDLNVKSPEVLRNGQTPWAFIENNSNAFIQTEELNDILFNNYPNIFIRSRSFADLAILLPEKMDDNYFKVLTNLFNLIGNYAESNVGEITYYKKAPKNAALENHNLIIFGTPKDNPMIRKLNDQLYFHYDKDFTRFVSNEKLSIEKDYGKQIGTAQLMFSPYNAKAAALILTGAKSQGVFLASTQVNTEKNTSMYKGDAIVVDPNYRRYDYRFKKRVSNVSNESLGKRIVNNHKLMIYLFVFLIGMTIIGLSAFFIVKKNLKGGE